MSRPARPVASPTLPAVVRAHFGLTQAELAAFVGVHQSLLAAVERGRKNLGPVADQRLQVLARQLPPPDGLGPPAPVFADEIPAGPPPPALPAPAPAGPDELAPLRRRLARCRWLRTRLLFEQGQQRGPSQARHLRRLWAVQVLGPALAAPLPPGHRRRRPRHPLAHRAGPAPGRHHRPTAACRPRPGPGPPGWPRCRNSRAGKSSDQ